MHYKLVDEKPKTFVLVFATGDELAQGLKAFASEQKLASASFKAIGALSSVRLGWLNWETKQYEPAVALDEPDVVHRQSLPGQELLGGGHGADAHHLGLDAGELEVDEAHLGP